MKRLYYLIDDLETTEQVSKAVHGAGVTDWNFHAISRDEAGLYRYHIHSATPYQELDFLHTGTYWALVGAATGLIIGLVAHSIQPLPVHIDALAVALFTLVCGGFGGWLGGMIGLSRENYKLAPFHAQLEAGKILLLVDVKKQRALAIQSMIRDRFPRAQYAGVDSTFINPFERPRTVYQQITH